VDEASDQARFTEVFVPYLVDAFRLARWLAGSRADAEDIVQEASMRAFKNIRGFSGGNPRAWVLTIVRKDLYERIGKSVPKIWSFKALAEAKSCLNTPPTFGVYFLLETFKWLEGQGGLAAVEKRNAEKAGLVYGAIDASGGFYKGTVADKAARSHMNLTFLLPSEELTDKFVKEASKAGMVALKGYRTVGGIRASMYNAMPVAGAKALADFMGTFAKANG